MPAVYRLRLAKDEKLSAIYFNPERNEVAADRVCAVLRWRPDGHALLLGEPLAAGAGNSTGRTIDDRIQFTPTHNSVMSWAGTRPAPLSTSELVTLDTLGRSRLMTVRRWAWLIGMSDAADARLVDWAESFATPPSLDLQGARLDLRRIRARAPGDLPGSDLE